MTRTRFLWPLRTRTLALGERTLLMGILNVTPDSFSDGNQFLEPVVAVAHGLALLDQGADILDLGGESTRPNATPITADAEQARILPVLGALLRARPLAIVSVDTYHAATAERAIEAGAEIINDVSGLLWDPAMAAVLARHRPGAILMHTRATPREWPHLAPLAENEVLPLVLAGLRHTLTLAAEAGILLETIVLDPGFGFGKIGRENSVLLDGFARLHPLGRPLLAGISRKRFLTAHLTAPTEAQRLEATTAANIAAIHAGAHILRVHDIPAAREAAAVAEAAAAEAAAKDRAVPHDAWVFSDIPQ